MPAEKNIIIIYSTQPHFTNNVLLVAVGDDLTRPTLKVITFSIHEDVVDQNDAEDTGPEMNITEHKHKANILWGKWFEFFKKTI